MALNNTQLYNLTHASVLGKYQAANGERFIDTPEMRATEQEELFRRQQEALANIEALNEQKMIESNRSIRRQMEMAKTLAYGRDILARPDQYEDGDAQAALDQLSGNFSNYIGAASWVRGMEENQPRKNLETYIGMLDDIYNAAKDNGANVGDKLADYYASEELREWDAIKNADEETRIAHAENKAKEQSAGNTRFTDMMKKAVDENLFNSNDTTQEETSEYIKAQLMIEGKTESEASIWDWYRAAWMDGASAKSIVRKRNEKKAIVDLSEKNIGAGHAGVMRSLGMDYLNAKRDLAELGDEKKAYGDITIGELIKAEQKRDEWVRRRRMLKAYEEKMDEERRVAYAKALLPSLTDPYEIKIALDAMNGEDLSKYKGYLMQDNERSKTLYAITSVLRPKGEHGAWEDFFNRIGESGRSGTYKAYEWGRSVWAAVTDWNDTAWTALGYGLDQAKSVHEEWGRYRKDLGEEIKKDLEFYRTHEAWRPNNDDYWVEQAVKGLADSSFLQGTAILAGGAKVASMGLSRVPHPYARAAATALKGVSYISEALGAASMVGEQYENMLMNGVDNDRAATIALFAGAVDWYVERMNIDSYLGLNMTPAELRRSGIRALCKAVAKKNPALMARMIKTDIKQAMRIAMSEAGEELLQGWNQSGALAFAQGEGSDVKSLLQAYLNKESIRQGVDSFIEALPTCTAFGVMGVSSPFRSGLKESLGAYEELRSEVVRKYANENKIDTSNKEEMARAERIVNERAAEHARATVGMDSAQRAEYFEKQTEMSPTEAAFYEQVSEYYNELNSLEGSQWANTIIRGEINYGYLEKMGFKPTFENGQLKTIRVGNDEYDVVAVRGTEFVTDANTGEKGYSRGSYENKTETEKPSWIAALRNKATGNIVKLRNSITITTPTSHEDLDVQQKDGTWKGVAKTTTIPHELTHAFLNEVAQSDLLSDEQKKEFAGILKGNKNEALAQVVEYLVNGAERFFSPDVDVTSVKNIVHNIFGAVRKAATLGWIDYESLPSIVKQEGSVDFTAENLRDPNWWKNEFKSVLMQSPAETAYQKRMFTTGLILEKELQALANAMLNPQEVAANIKASEEEIAAALEANRKALEAERAKRIEEYKVASERYAAVDPTDDEAVKKARKAFQRARQNLRKVNSQLNVGNHIRHSFADETTRYSTLKNLSIEATPEELIAAASGVQATRIDDSEILSNGKTYTESLGSEKPYETRPTKKSIPLNTWVPIQSTDSANGERNNKIVGFAWFDSVKEYTKENFHSPENQAEHLVPEGSKFDALDKKYCFHVAKYVPITPRDPSVPANGFQKARFSLAVGDSLSDGAKAEEFVEAFREYTGAKPPERLRHSDPKSAYEWFRENILGKTFTLGDRSFTVKEGHFYRFVCETPKDGKKKGWVDRASSPSESIRMLENGELTADDIAGYVSARAASLPYALDTLASPDAIIRRPFNKTFKDTVIKKFDTGSKTCDLAVFILNDDGKTLGLETIHRRAITKNFLNGNDLIAISNEVVKSPESNPADNGLSVEDNAGDTSSTYDKSIAQSPVKRNSLAGQDSPTADMEYLIAHETFARNGKAPTVEEVGAMMKKAGVAGDPRTVLANALLDANDMIGIYNKAATDPVIKDALEKAGLAYRQRLAQSRAKRTIMKFDSDLSKKREAIRKAYQSQIDNVTGMNYREMMTYYGLDMNELLKAMPPKARKQVEKKLEEGATDDTTSPVQLTPEEEQMVADVAKVIISRGKGLAEEAEKDGAEESEEETKSSHATDEKASGDDVLDADADDIAKGNAINAAIMKAIKESGISISNPIAMVSLIRRITEDYILRNPDTVKDLDPSNVFKSRVALARLASNLSSFAQAVAEGYAPSYARVRIARRCAELDAKGLTTLRQVERVGESIFNDLNQDVIRQSRNELMKTLHKGDKKTGWKGLDYYAKKHGVNMKESDRTVSAFGGAYIKFLRRAVDMSEAAVEKRSQELEDMIDSFTDVEDKEKFRDYENAKLELDILTAYGALRTKMPAQIEDASKLIMKFVAEDLEALEKRKEEFEKKRVELRDKMAAGIKGDPKLNGRDEDREVGVLYSLMGMLEVRASILTSRCKDAAVRDDALNAFGEMERALFHCATLEKDFVNNAREGMRNVIGEVFGRWFGSMQLAKLLDTRLDEATCKKLDRGDQHTQWRIGNVMQMYVSVVQSDYADNISQHGRDGDYAAQLKDIIEQADPRLMTLIERMRGLYADYGAQISATTMAVSGVQMQTPNPLYMPVSIRRPLRGKTGESRQFSAYAPALTPRVKHGLDFDQTADIMSVWMDRVTQSAHSVGYLELSPIIQGTLQSSTLLEKINSAWGKKAYTGWNDYVFNILSGARPKGTSMDKFAQFLSKTTSRMFMWGNLGSNLNQLSAIFTSALSRDAGGITGMLKNVGMWGLKPAQMWKTCQDLTSTRAFKGRYGSDLNAAVTAACREGKYGVMKGIGDTVTGWGMAGLTLMDKVGVMALANVYYSERKALEEGGMAPEEASEQAAEKLVLLADKTAQGTNAMNATDFQQNAGVWGNLFLQFKTAPLQQFQYEYAAYVDWMADKTNGAKARKLVAALVVNHILANIVPLAVAAMMTAIYGAINDDDDPEKEREKLVARTVGQVFGGSYGAIPLLGTLVDCIGSFIGGFVATGEAPNLELAVGGLPTDTAAGMAARVAKGLADHGGDLIEAVRMDSVEDIHDAITEMAKDVTSLTWPGRQWKRATREGRKPQGPKRN